MAIIVMGVSGCGKSTIARTLAEKSDRPWIDGDDLHTPEAKTKMQARIPLTDADRIPWLQKINHRIKENPALIVACSALKRSYRDIIQQGTICCFLQLNITYEDAYQRISHRENHFFPADLLYNQYDTFEPLAADESGIIISALEPPEEISQLTLEKIQALHC